MSLLEAIRISKDFAGTIVFKDVSLAIEPGERIGLVGPNGAGKTTLLRALLGLDDDIRGTVIRAPRLRMGYAAQHPDFPSDATCLDIACSEVLSLRAQLRDAEAQLGDLSGQALDAALADYGRLRDRYDAAGGDDADDTARRLLEKAGMGDRTDTRAGALSGGEQNVLELVRSLVDNPDLLVLDEPGNHLDFWGLAWLESFLRAQRRALVIVSHNRHVLDAVATRIVELDNGKATAYTGGYSRYRLEKGRAIAAQGADWQADRKKLDRLEALVQRFETIARSRPDPAWGKRLRARRSQLAREREQATERPALERRKMEVSFQATDVRSDIAIDVRGYSRRFGQRVLFSEARFDLLVGERVGLVGRNGCGKTTLVRDIVERGAWDDEVLRVGPSMRIGYCAQNQDVFRNDRTVLEEFEAMGAREGEVRTLLKRFGFRHADTGMRIDSMSGGERNRLQIARAVWLSSNFLVLDEPTNHLDIPSREAVEEGLADFDGTILVVSHDRWFLERVVDRILLVEDEQIIAYEGGLEEFWRDTQGVISPSARAGSIEARGRQTKTGAHMSPERCAEVGARPGDAPSLEARIESLERERNGLERRIACANAVRRFSEASRLSEDLSRLVGRIEKLYERL